MIAVVLITKNNNNALMSSQETEILNTKEDALIKKAEISAYKKVLKIAKKINDKDSTVVLKQNLQEKEFDYDKIKTSEDRMLNDIRSNNNNNNNTHEYFNLGSAVADMLTSIGIQRKTRLKCIYSTEESIMEQLVLCLVYPVCTKIIPWLRIFYQD